MIEGIESMYNDAWNPERQEGEVAE